MTDPWEEHADWWQREFTNGADPEYTEQILPLIQQHLPRSGRMLDMGCGEGQVARLAAEQGLQVVGLDPAFTQVALAGSRAGGPAYFQGSATDVGLATACVDAAVACLVFEHISQIDPALAELARVLRSGGTFLLLLNHPLLQTPGSGWIDDQVLDPPEQYWRVGPYLSEANTMEEVEQGVFIRFYHRPLSGYINAATEAGFRLERMEEPAPSAGFMARADEYAAASSIPRLMFLKFLKL
jgi:ubiquinone/menaquinone biosynthesis C-methylase UbiE